MTKPLKENEYMLQKENERFTIQYEHDKKGILRKIKVPLFYDCNGEPHTNITFALDSLVYKNKSELEKKIK